MVPKLNKIKGFTKETSIINKLRIMLNHHGQIIERVVRRNGHSITDVARLTNVNRRSIYNWFNQQELKPEIIYRLGRVINHDFSVELPQLFRPEDFIPQQKSTSYIKIIPKDGIEGEKQHYWKDKYITLLESYNSLLLNKLPLMVTGVAYLAEIHEL